MKTEMRKYIYLITVLFLMSSCGDFLDETPKGTLIPKTIDDFALMMDANDILSTNQISSGPSLMLMMSDDVKVTDDINKFSHYYNWGIKSYCWEDHLFTESESDKDYNAFYHVIYICNYILDNVDKAKEGGKFTKNYVEGAARFHRAFAYLSLVNLYARHYDPKTAETDLGVALLLGSNPNVQLDRSTVAQVYDQILKDTRLAVQLLENTAAYTFRPTKAAAYAMLARIYLYQGNYTECWKAARKAREITGVPADYNQFYLEAENPDDGIANISSKRWEYPDIICYKNPLREPNNYRDYNLSDELITLFHKETDLRWRLFVTTYKLYESSDPNGDEPRISSSQYPNNKGFNVGEIYITEAEACVRDKDIDGALFALNDLARKRHVAGTYQDVTERNPDKLLELILAERRRELMFKGTRWFDLKRLNKEARFVKTITHVYKGKTYTLSPDDNHYVLPIPLKVIGKNPSMVQNPR